MCSELGDRQRVKHTHWGSVNTPCPPPCPQAKLVRFVFEVDDASFDGPRTLEELYDCTAGLTDTCYQTTKDKEDKGKGTCITEFHRE